MRLIAEGLAARGTCRPSPRCAPTRCRSPRASLRTGSRSGSGPACAGRCARLTRRLAGPDRPGARRRLLKAAAPPDLRGGARYDRSMPSTRWISLDQGAGRARGRKGGRRGRRSPKIVLRMAGMSWHDAILQGATRPAPAMKGCSMGSTRSFPVGALARSGRGAPPRSASGSRPARASSPISGRCRTGAGALAGPNPEGRLAIPVATRFTRPQKRQDLADRGARPLEGRLDFRVTMVGTGDSAAEVIRRRDALGLADRVEILPFLPQEALWRAMEQADLLCHPLRP